MGVSESSKIENLKSVVNEKLSKLSQKEITLLIDEVNNENTLISRVNEIITEFSELKVIMTLPVGQEHFYRARYWSNQPDYPKNLSELLEPSAEKTGLGRCNIKEKPVLYVSAHPRALIAECRFKPGDIYVLTQFTRTLKTEDLNCLLLGLDGYHLFPQYKSMQEMEKFEKQFFGENYPLQQFIESQIHRQFVKQSEESPQVYNFTANLCDKFFSIIPDLDAIFYPSIETFGAVNNLAIRPNRYMKTYTATKAGLFEVLDDGLNSRQIMGTVINEDNTMDWSTISEIDLPVPSAIRQIDPNDSRIYIAPWKYKL